MKMRVAVLVAAVLLWFGWAIAQGQTAACVCGSETQDRSWHVLVTTYGGKVTLLKGLTKHEAEYTRNHLLGLPATPEEQNAADERRKLEWPDCPSDSATKDERSKWDALHPLAAGCIHHAADGSIDGSTGWTATSVSDSDVKSAEVFQ